MTILIHRITCKQPNNQPQFRIENIQTQNWIKNKERKGVENRLDLMNFGSTNPLDSQCFFESLDQMLISSSKVTTNSEMKMREREKNKAEKRKKKLKKNYSKNLFFS